MIAFDAAAILALPLGTTSNGVYTPGARDAATAPIRAEYLRVKAAAKAAAPREALPVTAIGRHCGRLDAVPAHPGDPVAHAALKVEEEFLFAFLRMAHPMQSAK